MVNLTFNPWGIATNQTPLFLFETDERYYYLPMRKLTKYVRQNEITVGNVLIDPSKIFYLTKNLAPAKQYWILKQLNPKAASFVLNTTLQHCIDKDFFLAEVTSSGVQIILNRPYMLEQNLSAVRKIWSKEAIQKHRLITKILNKRDNGERSFLMGELGKMLLDHNLEFSADLNKPLHKKGKQHETSDL